MSAPTLVGTTTSPYGLTSPFDGTVEPIVLILCSDERKAVGVALACATAGREADALLDAASAAAASLRHEGVSSLLRGQWSLDLEDAAQRAFLPVIEVKQLLLCWPSRRLGASAVATGHTGAGALIDRG